MAAAAGPSYQRPSRTPAQDHYNSDSARKRRRYQQGGEGSSRRLFHNANGQRTPIPSTSRSRRDTQPDKPTYDSAAQAAAAATGQVDGYKPREERSWEEFHPDLDIESKITAFSAIDVDGVHQESQNNAAVDQQLYDGSATKSLEGLLPNGIRPRSSDMMPTLTPTPRRRPGRPPRRPEAMLYGLGSPPAPKIIPLPAQNPRERLNLPKPSYRKIATFAAYEADRAVQVNYVDRTMANAGFQESEMYLRSDRKFIRLEEESPPEGAGASLMLETEKDQMSSMNLPPFTRVEYDMDEQDGQWLDAQNLIRKDEQVEAIKPGIFEITMTQIEKEWHALEKKIPKPNPKPPQTHRPRSSSAAAVNGEPAAAGEEQDSKCAVCDDGECENSNAIVFCDGCDLAVHQECYGVPFIPEGQWLCRKCQLIGKGVPTCVFCPNTDGAFKLTHESRWSHLICAIWIPEVNLANATFMEPVMDVGSVPRQRWKLTCYICNQKMGACIQCGNRNCFQAFHVTCARRAKLFLKMKSTHGGPAKLDASVLKAYCDKHVPPEWAREHDVENATSVAKDHYRRTMKGRRWADSQQSAMALLPSQQNHLAEIDDETNPRDETQAGGNAAAQRRKRLAAQKNVWRLPSGAPIVPQVVFDAVTNSLQRFGIRKRKEFAAEACKYWTLKREARRGAALLKRLQLQLETFSSTEVTRRNFVAMGSIGRARLRRRIEMADKLLEDLATIRQICRDVKEREARKLEDGELQKDMVDMVYFPITMLLEPILRKAQNLDPRGMFSRGFESIQARLENRAYATVSSFTTDLGRLLLPVITLDMSTGVSEVQRTQTGALSEIAVRSVDPKEAKKLVRRIAKAIQQPLQDALRKECDLSKRSFEHEVGRLEWFLKGGFDGTDQDSKGLLNGVDPATLFAPSVDGEATILPLASSNGVNDADGPRSKSVLSQGQINSHGYALGPMDGLNAAEKHPMGANGLKEHSRLETAEAIDPLIGQQFNGISGEEMRPIEESTVTATQSEVRRSTANPVTREGVPWYLETFDIVGTQVQDERWTGGEVLRGMSEELSEMGEEELQDLGDGFVGEAPAPDARDVKKTPSKKRKRNRYW